MTITLDDIAMITGLPIEGRALTRKVRSHGWRQRVAALVGVEPEPWTHETRKDPRPSHVLFLWIQKQFCRCPKDASTDVVERYDMAYVWNLLTQEVFPDGMGDTTSWMFLDPLCDWDVKWSWGSVALAFLYRQLDGACMWSKSTSTLRGFVWALQIWMWECIPVGRNITLPPEEPWKYPFDGDEERTNRQNNKNAINWEEHHIMWVDMWNAQRNARVETDQTPDTNEAAYLRHLEWICKEYRVIHKGAWTCSDCLDVLPSEADDGAFNNSIRETV
ncbi:hypothetical protein D1007_11425 [Hordeum vulgare]|nr:hypothetical protein D1007_11425 [Hordeum vulgare]